jgi:hypothetical protein
VGHREMGATEICRPGFPVFIFDVGELESTNKVHIDFRVVPALARFLLSANAGDDIIELLDVFVECL